VGLGSVFLRAHRRTAPPLRSACTTTATSPPALEATRPARSLEDRKKEFRTTTATRACLVKATRGIIQAPHILVRHNSQQQHCTDDQYFLAFVGLGITGVASVMGGFGFVVNEIESLFQEPTTDMTTELDNKI